MRPLCACIAALLVSCFLMAAPAHGQVMMAEIRIDDGTAGNDDPAEYFELRGQPGTSISDLTYVVLGRRPIQTISGIPYWGAGVIVGLLKFPSGAVIGANGRYTVRQVGTPMYQGLSANLTTLLDFEDDATQTHLLVRNFDFGIFDDGTDPQVGFSPVPYDLDLDNDGALDITPWQEVVDGLSFLESTTFDSENRAYAVQRVGPAQWGIPSHAWRCANNQNWRLGTQAFGLRTIGSQQVTAPSAEPFDGANPYDKVVLGVGEVGSAMRIKMTVYADMEDPSHTLSVLIDGVLVGTVAGGLPACGSGTITVTAPMDLVNQTLCRYNGNLPLQIIPSGSVAACAGSSCQVTLLFEAPELTPGDSPQLFNAQCGCACDYPRGVVDVVFVVDTSESMADEAAALCSAIPDVINAISNQGALVNPMVLGITETPGGDFGCLTSSVAATLGMFVPDSTGIPIRLLDHPESWGDAAAVVAWNYGWTTGAARLVVTISDEAPFEGSGILGNECDLADADSIANAIAVANARGVAVSTLVGTGAIDCVVDLATALAQGTGGGTAVTTLPSSEIAAIVADFILDATSAGCGSCRGDLNFDGVVDAEDNALFDCLRGHTCRDVNNDGVAGTAADRALTQAAHVCAAIDFCGITTQSCLVEHVTPGCMDAACCNLVCGTDPFCCETGWDGSCVVLAVQLCGLVTAAGLISSSITAETAG